MKTLHSVLILLSLSPIAYAEGENVIDSIVSNCIKSNRHDTDIAKCLDMKSFEISAYNPHIGIELAKKTLQYSNQHNWLRGIALANNELAVNYNMLGNFDSAAHYYGLALKYFTKMGNLKAQSSVMTNISLVYKSKGDYVTALECLDKALNIQSKAKMPLAEGITLENIGSIFMELKDYKTAKNYYSKANNIYLQLNDSVSLARNLINTGIIYDKSGLYDSALLNLKTALRIHTKNDRIHSIQVVHSNLGIVYMHMRKFNEAIEQHNKAIEYSKRMKSESSLALDHGNIGEVYLERFKLEKKMSDLESAVSYLKSGFFRCQQIGFTPPQIEFGEKLLEAIELKGSDFELAYTVLKQKTHLQDSIFSKDNSLKIQSIENANVMAEKEHQLKISKLENKLSIQENKKHKQHKTILILVIAVFGLTILLLYIIYTNRDRLFKKKMSEISQFQSHQLRLPVVKILSIVESLKTQQNDPIETEKLLNMLEISTNELDLRIHEVVDRTKKK